MEPVSAVLVMSVMTAAAAHLGSEAARRALADLSALARRFRHRDPEQPDPGDTGQGPADEAAAAGPEAVRHYADALLDDAARDPECARELEVWVRTHAPALGVPGDGGAVTNTVTGDARITGPVVQGRDFHGGITFGGPER